MFFKKSISISTRDDIVIVELNPTQEYRPEIIMEVCTRAISFWTYQTSQEIKYREMTQKSQEDKISLLEKQLQRVTREFNAELGLRDAMNSLQRDLEQEKRKSIDLSEQLDEKSRQLSKLQTLYEQQKRRPIFSDNRKLSSSGQEKAGFMVGAVDHLDQPYPLLNIDHLSSVVNEAAAAPNPCPVYTNAPQSAQAVIPGLIPKYFKNMIMI
ncbi:cyclin B1 interacting protein 1, E3 ubiquitin protein ligase [Lobosporangium transversale]|nr:cyclin B1 interacting protein 1, E3 ubiquitin protein ligase [Lobosporangium transversale]